MDISMDSLGGAVFRTLDLQTPEQIRRSDQKLTRQRQTGLHRIQPQSSSGDNILPNSSKSRVATVQHNAVTRGGFRTKL